jgi:hypothetical protein
MLKDREAPVPTERVKSIPAIQYSEDTSAKLPKTRIKDRKKK